MQDFQKLRVWQAAHRITVAIYRTTARFPSEERYGLTSQLRRSAASIGANIAEACGRGSDPDARRCLYIALGSACEVLNHLLLARDLELVGSSELAPLERGVSVVRRMLIRLIGRLSGK